MNSEQICKNCDFWDQFECGQIFYNDTRHKEDNAWIAVHVHDDSGLSTSLRTGPLFGCNKFKIRVEK